MDSLDKQTFKGLRVVSISDENLDMTQDEKLKYIGSRDESDLKFKEGTAPVWYYFKSMTYKEVMEFTDDSSKSTNLKAIELFIRNFIGVSRGEGKIKTKEELLSENSEFQGPEAIANLFVDQIGFDSLVVLGTMAFNLNYLGKKNKRSLV